jgi:diacylglycerol kinase (ATP)
MNRRLLIIANPDANAGRTLQQLRPRLEAIRRQAARVDLQVTKDRRQAMELVQARAGDYDAVVAAGGDGTVNTIAHALFMAGKHGIPMGIMPLGTGNDAARALGLADPEVAMRSLMAGPTRAMDLIEVKCQEEGRSVDRLSLVYAAAGFAADVLRRTTPLVKHWFGPRVCYTVGLLRALVGLRCPLMRVRASHIDLQAPLLLVAAGNGEAAGAGMMRLFPGANVEDGRFNVILIGAMGRFQALRRCAHLYRGTHVRLPEVQSFMGTTLSIESQPQTEIQVDGEICGSTPACFVLRPQALQVLIAS